MRYRFDYGRTFYGTWFCDIFMSVDDKTEIYGREPIHTVFAFTKKRALKKAKWMADKIAEVKEKPRKVESLFYVVEES